MNALDDGPIMRELYAASRDGVTIDLVVRSHSQLRPGLPGFSENIRVRSILGRFLEHDRVYAFHNDGDPQLFVGSADCRERNLDRRVEALVPIRQPALRDRVLAMLELAMRDNTRAWELRPDGSYVRRAPGEGEPVTDLHEELMRDAARRAGSAPHAWELRGESRESRTRG
jgi:polyphosphate kinase